MPNRTPPVIVASPNGHRTTTVQAGDGDTIQLLFRIPSADRAVAATLTAADALSIAILMIRPDQAGDSITHTVMNGELVIDRYQNTDVDITYTDDGDGDGDGIDTEHDQAGALTIASALISHAIDILI